MRLIIAIGLCALLFSSCAKSVSSSAQSSTSQYTEAPSSANTASKGEESKVQINSTTQGSVEKQPVSNNFNK